MTLDMGQEDTREYLAPNAPAVDFVSVLSHMIRSTSDNPAQLRGAIYELARIKLQKEGWRRDPPLSILEMRRLNLALETAIELVEAISSRRDELAVLRSLYRLIEGSNTECAVLTRGRDEWSPVIHQPPIVTNSPNRLPTFLTVAQRAPLSRIWRWFSTTLVLQGCLVAILSVILSVILDRQFDLFGVKTHPWAAVIAPTSQNNASAAPKPAPQASRSDVSAISSALTSAPQASQSAVPSASPEAKPVLQGTHPIISSQAPVLPLPDLYGVYAVSGAKLYELESLPGRVPDQKVFMSTLIKSASRVVLPEGKIVFVVYRRDMAAAAPDRMSVRSHCKGPASYDIHHRGQGKRRYRR